MSSNSESNGFQEENSAELKSMTPVQKPRKTFGARFAKVFRSFRKRKSKKIKTSKEDISEMKSDSDLETPVPSLKKSSNEDFSDLKSDSDLATPISSLKICSEEDSSEKKNDSDLTTPASSSKICSEDDSSEIQNDSDLTTPASSSLSKICSEEDSSGAKNQSDLTTPDSLTKKCCDEDSSETKTDSDLTTADSSSMLCSKEDSYETKINYCGSTTALQKGVDLVTKATEEDKKKNYEEAFRLYEHGVEYFIHVIKYEAQSDRAKEIIRAKCAQYLERAEKLKKHLMHKQKSKKPGGETFFHTMHRSEDSSDEEEEKISKRIKDEVEFQGPYCNWSDIAGLEKEKEALKEAVVLPFAFPHLFSGKRQPWKRILLFGPTGTGKSLLANAVATEARHSNFLSVSQSHLLGENEKFARNLFKLAKRRKPCIIFIDVIDTLCLSSKEQDSGGIAGMKAAFLEQMQDDTDGVVILAVTNKPWKLDADILRRFEKKIYIPLPDEKDRQEIFKIKIGDTPNSLNEWDFRLLAKSTDGFSGADISVLVQDALMMPLRIVQSATHFVKVRGPSQFTTEDDFLTPCSPGTHGSIEMSWLDVPHKKLLEPVLSLRHVMVSLENSKRTVDDGDLWQFKRFMEG